MSEFHVAVGDRVSFRKTVGESDVYLFAGITGDLSPNHVDEEFMKASPYGRRIAHGALTASYISGILGNDLPGPGSIFVGLNMRFRRPVYIGSHVTVKVEVTEMKERGNRVTLKVSCNVDGKAAISGEAMVMVPSRDA